jgi:hypothetical protein
VYYPTHAVIHSFMRVVFATTTVRTSVDRITDDDDITFPARAFTEINTAPIRAAKKKRICYGSTPRTDRTTSAFCSEAAANVDEKREVEE